MCRVKNSRWHTVVKARLMKLMLFSGFKFGMILQIAVGPISILIFQLASTQGLIVAEVGAVGVTVADMLFILAAIWGIGALIERSSRIKSFLKYFGAAVLIVFGLSNILGVFGVNLIPAFSFDGIEGFDSVFIRMMLFTLSNPLTIVFWAGIFSAKIADGQMNTKDMYLFGLGAAISTIFFMSLIAAVGSLTGTFIPQKLIAGLNVFVGAALIYFGFKTALRKI